MIFVSSNLFFVCFCFTHYPHTHTDTDKHIRPLDETRFSYVLPYLFNHIYPLMSADVCARVFVSFSLLSEHPVCACACVSVCPSTHTHTYTDQPTAHKRVSPVWVVVLARSSLFASSNALAACAAVLAHPGAHPTEQRRLAARSGGTTDSSQQPPYFYFILFPHFLFLQFFYHPHNDNHI